MDIDLARTFVELSRTRHFGRAAETLFLTQSAVSARIRQLETQLGCRLFTRDRHNIQLTAAGRRFLPHATAMLNAWNRARQAVGVAEEATGLICLGTLPTIWDAFLEERFNPIRTSCPGVVFSLDVAGADSLTGRLSDGAYDLVFVFDVPALIGMRVTEVGRLSLVLIADREGIDATTAVGHGFIQVDWGMSFGNAFARQFAESAPPAMRTNLGRVARSLLLDLGGSAYLPESFVADLVATGRVFPVVDAPVFERTIYAAYPEDGNNVDIVERLLQALN